MGILAEAIKKPAPAAPAAARMSDHAGYAAATARLAKVAADQAAVEEEVSKLSAELLKTRAEAYVDPVRREALDLLGVGDKAYEERQEKEKRLRALRHRAAVCRVAADEALGFMKAHDRAAARAVLDAAAPRYKQLLAEHARATVAAAKALAPLLDFADAVAAEVSGASCGLPEYSLRLLGDFRQPDSNVSAWIAELVGVGLLDGREDFLDGVAFYAKRPDGSVVNHAPPAPRRD